MSSFSLRKLIPSPSILYVKTISTSAATLKAKDQLPPRPTLPDSELNHVYLKGSGPGGQKINKTSSACQMTHIPTGTVVKSQATRSRSENYKIARRILAEKIELLEKGDESRVAKKEERVKNKKASREKKSRRKYRALEGDRAADDEITKEEVSADELDETSDLEGVQQRRGAHEPACSVDRTTKT